MTNMDFKEKYTLKQNFFGSIIDLINAETDKEFREVFTSIKLQLFKLRTVCTSSEIEELKRVLIEAHDEVVANGV